MASPPNDKDCTDSNNASLSIHSIVIALVCFIAGILTPPMLHATCDGALEQCHPYLSSFIQQTNKQTKSTPNLLPETSKKRKNIGCTPDHLSEFIHESQVPGFHILCINADNDNNDDGETLITSTTFYRHGTEANKFTSETAISSWKEFKDTLIRKLIPPQNDAWGIFTPQGKILVNYSDDKRMIKSGDEDQQSVLFDQILDTKMILLIEGGTWFWPGVRIGFKRTIELYNHQNITLETLSTHPLVISVQGFLSVEECTYIQDKATPLVKHASGVSLQDQDHGKEASNWRTSQSAFIQSAGDKMLMELEVRTASLTRIPKHHQEDVQILKYGYGQKYDAHTDYFDIRLYQKDQSTIQLTKNGKRNRFATVFWYLSDVEEGGHTIFPRFNKRPQPTDFTDCTTGLKVKPEMGKVIIFYSLLPNGVGDPLSLHAACPVEEGIKWAGNKWIWNAPMNFVPP